MPEGIGGSAATGVQVMFDGTSLMVRRFDGGHCRADVITVLTGAGVLPSKSLSVLKFEPMSWEMALPIGDPMLQGINAFLGNQHVRRTGTVTFADARHEARAYLDFRNALITEVGFPALDGSSKEPAYFTVTFRPEQATRRPGDKKELQGAVNVKQKTFQASHFRLTIGGLPCSRVMKVDAMAFTMKVQEHVGGRHRFPELIPTTIEYPNLVLTIAEVDAPRWEQWFDDFVIRGNNGSDKELSGQIECLAPNAKDVLATLELSHVGIFELRHGVAEGGKDQVARFSVSMYFEGASLKV